MAKVRLLDIIEPTTAEKAALWKIQAKHIDFVLIDDDGNIIIAIELDDDTHKRPDRIHRDEFVNNALKKAGVTIVHITDLRDIETIKEIYIWITENSTKLGSWQFSD